MRVIGVPCESYAVQGRATQHPVVADVVQERAKDLTLWNAARHLSLALAFLVEKLGKKIVRGIIQGHVMVLECFLHATPE